MQKTDDGCEFTDTDNGKGLTEAQLGKYNDSAYSESEQNDKSEPGHGFGLRLVHQIALAHGGNVSFENVPGGGLSVNVSLPKAPYPFEGIR